MAAVLACGPAPCSVIAAPRSSGSCSSRGRADRRHRPDASAAQARRHPDPPLVLADRLEPTAHRGIPVTTPARTLADLRAASSPDLGRRGHPAGRVPRLADRTREPTAPAASRGAPSCASAASRLAAAARSTSASARSPSTSLASRGLVRRDRRLRGSPRPPGVRGRPRRTRAAPSASASGASATTRSEPRSVRSATGAVAVAGIAKRVPAIRSRRGEEGPRRRGRGAVPDRRELARLPGVLRAARVDRDRRRAADERDLRVRVDDGQDPHRPLAEGGDRRLGQGLVGAREGLRRVQVAAQVAAGPAARSSGRTWRRSPRRSASQRRRRGL